ncbi:MAG: hypothetical protein SGILL_005438, partial [Bacillariaceae sp.]
HQRERIVEGKTGEASPEEIVQSVEGILNRPATKRRHRKSHGRISFGDLARTIAESWKSVSPKAKSIFEHYAERDSLRYKRELKVWKDKKDLELEASTMAKHSDFINSMNMSSSMRSESSTTSAYLDSLPREGSISMHSTSGNPARSFSNSFNSSMTSMDGPSFHLPTSGEPESVQQAFQRQQQLLQQQLRMDNHLNPSAGFSGINMVGRGGGDMPRMTPGSNAFHSSFSGLPSANRMSISNSSVDNVTSSNPDGFEGVSASNMGPQGAMDTSRTSTVGGGADGDDPEAVDPLLGSSMQNRFSGMMSRGPHNMREGFGGMGSMMGHASFSGGFMSHPQHEMMLPNAAMMNMMSQQGQISEMEFMQYKLDRLQEQQRRLQMQQQGGMGPMSAMGNASNASLQFGGDSTAGGVVSLTDRSHSEHTASSLSTAGHASGQGFGFTGGMPPARSFQQLQQQQQLMMMQQQAAMGQDGGPMSISNSGHGGRHPSAAEQQQMNEFMSRQGYGNNMDMSNSSRQNH